MANLFAKQPFVSAYPLVHKMLLHEIDCLRNDLLEKLRALTPLLVALGGEETAVEIGQAIIDIGRWWP